MKVFFFVSAKGGCGKSLLVKNISNAISADKKVLVAELSDKGRYLDLLFDITDSVLYDISDYCIENIGLDECITSINDNLDVICSSLEHKQLNVEMCINKLLSEADDRYDYLIVDLCDNSYIDTLKSCCNDCEYVLVTDCSFMSIRNAETLLNYIGDNFKSRLVINRVNPSRIEKGYDIAVDGIIEALRIPLLGVVYEFEGGYDNKMNLCKKDDEILSKRIFDSISRRIQGENVPVTECKNGIIKKLFG